MLKERERDRESGEDECAHKKENHPTGYSEYLILTFIPFFELYVVGLVAAVD